MNRKRIVGMFAVMLPILLGTASVSAQDHQGHHAGTMSAAPARPGQGSNPKGGMAHKGMMAGKMGGHCAMMMQTHQKMESDFKVQDAKIKELTAAMDKATGDQKITAMAALLKELVAQRTGRHAMMDNMQSQMMEHMMEHMQQDGKAGMMQCPMMKGMMGGKGMMGK
jgi:hypothetical protein